MISNPASRRSAVTAGVLFIIATVASLAGTAVEQPIAGGADYLTRFASEADRVSVGGLFELIAAGTSVGIAISLYPLLKRVSAGLALGSVVFRAVEGVMYTVGAVSLLSLQKIGQAYVTAPAAERGAYLAIGDSFQAVREEAILAGVFAFIAGAAMYYAVFYRSQLVPRWLSGWGLIAVVLMLAACVSALFTGRPVTTYVILILPIAVQEMVLALWLIFRGFNSPAAETVGSWTETVKPTIA